MVKDPNGDAPLVNAVVVVLVEDDEDVVHGPVGVQEVEPTPSSDFVVAQLAVRVGVLWEVEIRVRM